jgi:hypothetical protein
MERRMKEQYAYRIENVPVHVALAYELGKF